MADEGYIVPNWPRPWGRDAGAVEQLVIDEEFRKARIRRPHLAVGAWALPTIITHGTAEQQERWVRPTLLGELSWCQMFSEPGAGSDLASLTTKAVRTEGGWLLSGQKVWTSMAREADLAICLARTNSDVPKHLGITYFILDMRAEGLDIRPLRELTGVDWFNEIFLSDVFVPDDCVVGPVDGGWPLARNTLANERVSMGSGSSFGYGVEALLGLVAGTPAATDSLALDTLGGLLAEAQSLALLGYRGTARSVSGADPDPAESSVRKLLGVEHEQRVQEYGLELLGPAAATTVEGDRRDVDQRLPRQPLPHDRRRHQRGPAQPHRRARAGPAARPLNPATAIRRRTRSDDDGGVVRIEYACLDGSPFPVEFADRGDLGLRWVIDREHAPTAMTPLADAVAPRRPTRRRAGVRRERPADAVDVAREPPQANGYDYYVDDWLPVAERDRSSGACDGSPTSTAARGGSGWTTAFPGCRRPARGSWPRRGHVLSSPGGAARVRLEPHRGRRGGRPEGSRAVAASCEAIVGDRATLVAYELAQGSENDTISADVALWQIARTEPGSPVAHAALEEFLATYGSRGHVVVDRPSDGARATRAARRPASVAPPPPAPRLRCGAPGGD